jgi:hypothetical protein
VWNACLGPCPNVSFWNTAHWVQILSFSYTYSGWSALSIRVPFLAIRTCASPDRLCTDLYLYVQMYIEVYETNQIWINWLLLKHWSSLYEASIVSNEYRGRYEPLRLSSHRHDPITTRSRLVRFGLFIYCIGSLLGISQVSTAGLIDTGLYWTERNWLHCSKLYGKGVEWVEMIWTGTSLGPTIPLRGLIVSNTIIDARVIVSD